MSLLLLVPASAPCQTEREIEDLFWRSVECQSRLQVQAYLEVYPTGRYVAEAWACLEGQLGLDRADRVLVQQGLAAVGHDPGPADGLFGGETTRTRQAIRTWQATKGLAETGYLTREQTETLMALGQEAQEAERAAQAQAEQAAQEEAARQAREADDAAYAQAQRVDTAAAYADYLQAYPTGQHMQEARARQATAEAREQAARADDAAYAAAESQNTPEGYEEYLRAYPAGRHAAEARVGQRRLREEGARQQILAQVNTQMVRVTGGTFTMGCQEGFFSDCSDDEEPAHRVEIRSFELSKYEVTQELWEAVMEENPNEFKNCPQCPVERVSWNDAQAFLQKLNVGGGRYRLPSETEWEYTARGGSRSRGYEYAGSDNPNAVAWYDENSGSKTHPVGQKQANELGVYDLSGNVREWVQDCWNDNYTGAPSDGRA